MVISHAEHLCLSTLLIQQGKHPTGLANSTKTSRGIGQKRCSVRYPRNGLILREGGPPRSQTRYLSPLGHLERPMLLDVADFALDDSVSPKIYG